jgi:glycosyltransferase involved in cell wall biosynthesis
MVAWAEGRGFEVAFVNTATATAILGAEVAARLGIPTVCSIHESQGPRALWRKLDPQVRAMAEGALRDAAVRLFVADSTRVLFEPWRGDGEALTIPYGIDFEPIDSVREGFDRAAARGEAGIPAGAKLVLCVGSVEPRKAQASLTQAFERIADRHPDAHLALVGANRDDAAKLLGAYIDASPHRGRIDLVPMTPEVQRWYGIADLAVCASDIESLPRSVVEAMAWELPVLATDVFGLPDVVEERRTGWLCPPSDIGALAEGLDRALGTGAGERAEMGRRGRALVERRHSLPEYGRAVGEILRELSSGGTGDGAKSLGDG